MARSNQDMLNTYWGLIKGLNTNWQLELMERLSQTVRKNLEKKTSRIQQSFGAWESENSAEEIIEELRQSRHTDRQIETL